MSCFSLFVEEASDDRVSIIFRVSGLQNVFTNNNYSEILLTTDDGANGTISTDSDKKRMSFRCGYNPGQYDKKYIMWGYDSTDDPNNDDGDGREYFDGFVKGTNLTLYAYAKVEKTWWQIGNPITFNVSQPEVWIEYDGSKTWLCLRPGYLNIFASNFTKYGYAIGDGPAMVATPKSNALCVRMSVSFDEGIETGYEAYLYTNDGETWKDGGDEGSYDADSDGKKHRLTGRGYRWYVGGGKYTRGLPAIGYLTVTAIDGGLNVNWAAFKGADSYTVILYNADNSEDVYPESETEVGAVTTDIDIEANPCTRYKVSVQAYNEDGEAISSLTYAEVNNTVGIYTTPPAQPYAVTLNIDESAIKSLRLYLDQPYKEGLVIWVTIEQPSGVAKRLKCEMPSSQDDWMIGYVLENIELQEEGIHAVKIRSEYNNIYCKDEYGNDHVFVKTIKVPRPLEWSWSMSNGEATPTETFYARLAIGTKGEAKTFRYTVWNDMVNKCIRFLEYTGNVDTAIGEELSSDYYGKNRLATNTYKELLNDAIIDEGDRTLYAYKFNLLRYCIGSQPQNSTGISCKKRDDPVIGEEIYELAETHMNNIIEYWEKENLK